MAVDKHDFALAALVCELDLDRTCYLVHSMGFREPAALMRTVDKAHLVNTIVTHGFHAPSDVFSPGEHLVMSVVALRALADAGMPMSSLRSLLSQMQSGQDARDVLARVREESRS
jgi:hypothetical protein